MKEDDLIPLTPESLEWQRRIHQEHKQLQQSFKSQLTAVEKSNKKRIDGAAFLKAWKPKLDALLVELSCKEQKRPRKKPKTTSDSQRKQQLQQQFQLRTQQHLSLARTTAEMEQVNIPFGLKRILVEEWEILNGPFGMIHDLNSKSSIRKVLQVYLESKGVSNASLCIKAGESPIAEAVSDADRLESAPGEHTEPMNAEETKEPSIKKDLPADAVNDETEKPDEVPPVPSSPSENHSDDELERKRLENEWLDMAKGICLLFDQALPFRLLYPTEQAQLSVLLDEALPQDGTRAISKRAASLSLSDYYGCAHLLRLCCQLPSLLMDQYRQKEAHFEEEIQQVLVKPILAKVNDLLRFLQKHQDEYFPQRFRKKNENELKYEQKWIKRLERKRMTAVAEGHSLAETANEKTQVQIEANQ